MLVLGGWALATSAAPLLWALHALGLAVSPALVAYLFLLYTPVRLVGLVLGLRA